MQYAKQKPDSISVFAIKPLKYWGKEYMLQFTSVLIASLNIQISNICQSKKTFCFLYHKTNMHCSTIHKSLKHWSEILTLMYVSFDGDAMSLLIYDQNECL